MTTFPEPPSEPSPASSVATHVEAAVDRIVAAVGSRAYGRELALALGLAREAGRIQMERYERLERIEHKGPRDVVTEVDHLCEGLVMRAVQEHYPADAFYAEEIGEVAAVGRKPVRPREPAAGADRSLSGGRPSGEPGPAASGAVDPGEPGPAARVWIVDPLDGTINYANGIPFFCIAIALVEAGRPVMGVVYDPTRDEMFAATLDGAPTRNGEPIRVGEKDRLEDLVVTLAIGGRGMLRRRRNAVKSIRAHRSMGSASLTLSYVACGRFDIYAQGAGLSAWDVAAPGLIAERAGATVTELGGGPWFDLARPAKKWSLLAAAPRHHAAMLELLAPPAPPPGAAGEPAPRRRAP